MRFKKHMKLEYGLKQIDIAPLIDVVFLLIIFFMLTSSFVVQAGIKVNLPKAITSDLVQKETIEIIISKENVIYFNNKVVTAAQLKSTLKGLSKKDRSVFIKADRHTSLGKIVEIWDMCRDIGLTQVSIATNQR